MFTASFFLGLHLKKNLYTNEQPSNTIYITTPNHTIVHKKNLATIACNKVSGWKMGFEPTTLGTTILYSNRLSYIHHLICFPNRCANVLTFF